MSLLFAFFFSPIGRYVGIGIVSALVVWGAYLKGDFHGRAEGKAEIKRQWNDATAADIKRGEDARRQAEAYIAQDPPTGVRRIIPSRMPNDKWDRDQSAVQPVASHHLFKFAGHADHGQSHPSPQSHGPASTVLVTPTTPSCATIKMALKTLPKAVLDHYAGSATPEQKAAGEKCLKGS